MGIEQGDEGLLEVVTGDPCGFLRRDQSTQGRHTPVPRVPRYEVSHRERAPQPPHFELVKRPFDLPLRRYGREVEDRPRRRRDRNPFMDRHLVGRQEDAVGEEAWPSANETGPAHFRFGWRERDHSPKLPGGAMTQRGIRPEGKRRSHPTRVDSICSMSNCVDAVV
ncbi:MAG: hypothetical protein JJE35_06955 [Thermoleophilia bacterium]|nr:hypothetical protein [Thermoleophilia bacterium]